MSTSVSALGIRSRLGRDDWGPPQEFGTDGWWFPNRREHGHIIVTCSDHPDFFDIVGAGIMRPIEIVHASMAFADRLPTYDELTLMHAAVWPHGYAYMILVPPEFHVNIHENALHLWGRLDGKPLVAELSALLPSGARSI